MSITSTDGKIKATITGAELNSGAPIGNIYAGSVDIPTTTFLNSKNSEIKPTISIPTADLKITVGGLEEVVSDFYSMIDNT